MSPERTKKTLSPTAEQLGLALRQRRLNAKISQEELGFAAETHRTYIGALERGQKAITVEKLVLLAQALGCQASQILQDCGL